MNRFLEVIGSQPLFLGCLALILSMSGCRMWLFHQTSDPQGLLRASQARVSAKSEKGIGFDHPDSDIHSGTQRNHFYYSLAASCSVTVLVLLWTSSFIIALPFTFFSAIVTYMTLTGRAKNELRAMSAVWPEVTDHLISGIHSGLSLSEAMSSLAIRGPEIIRPNFLRFRDDLNASGDFTKAVEDLKERFQSHGSDQILEAILLAKSLGGSELLGVFRTLGDFLRQDLALRKEIEIKHGWIKNSAHLSSVAPWLLLLLLSGQPGTVDSFSSLTGIFILGLGVVLTIMAYLWMGRLAKLPQTPRVFFGL